MGSSTSPYYNIGSVECQHLAAQADLWRACANIGTPDSRVRWHRAVRNVVALNNMRLPPEPVPEEENEGAEEEEKPRPGLDSFPVSPCCRTPL